MKDYLLLFAISAETTITYLHRRIWPNICLPGRDGSETLQGKLTATQPIEYQGIIVNNDGIHEGPDKGGNNVLVAGFLITLNKKT